jgi:hypothetical protein
VQIARRTLSVQTTAVNATGSVSVDWQFAFRPKDAPLRLVGLRTETTLRTVDNTSRRTVASSNLVNGERIEVEDAVVNGRRSRREQRSRLAPHTAILLSDFAFDASALADDVRPEPALSTVAGSLGGS